MTRFLHRLRREDRGSISVSTAASMAMILVLLAGVTTVHGKNDAQSRADGIAAEAARAAETAINTRGTTLAVDPVDAQTAASTYLAAASATGTVTIVNPTLVRVTAAVDRPAVFGVFGPSYHASATKDAVLRTGRDG
jgi:Flp pilus assembly protein TadG